MTTEKFQGEVTARLRGIDKRLERIDHEVDCLKKDRTEITKINTILEITVQNQKEMQIQMKEQNKVLSGISQNLKNLNEKFDNLDERVDTLEVDMKETENVNYANVSKRIDSIEEIVKKTEQKSKIDIVELTKNIITYVVPSIILAAVLLWLGLR